MTLKKYQRIKIIIVVALSLSISQCIVRENFIVPIMLMVVASLLLWYLRSKTKEVVYDERDLALGGKAALLAMQVFGWLAAIGMFFLYSQRALNPMYGTVAATLSYSVLFLFLVYSIIYRYYNKFKLLQKRPVYLAIAIFIIILLVIFGIRLFSGEDNWVCKDGQWQKHGQPSFAAPNVECK